MKTSSIIIIGAALVPLLGGCASQPVVLSPVGPGSPSLEAHVPSGCIQVYSDTRTHVIGDGPPYYTHMGYNIYDQTGKRVRYVPNHIGDMDETPMIEQIPAGKYNVVAMSSSYGRLTVPVIIRPDKTTILHLDRGWRPSSELDSNAIVRLPDGEAVGWNGLVANASR